MIKFPIICLEYNVIGIGPSREIIKSCTGDGKKYNWSYIRGSMVLLVGCHIAATKYESEREISDKVSS